MKKLIRLLLIAGGSLMLVGVSYAYDCSSAAQYVDGSSYSTGSIVQNNGHAYQCTVGGWCTVGGPYAPGAGWAWTSAWSDLGACSGGGNPPPSSGNPPPSSGNPPPSSGNPPPSSDNPPPSSGNPPPSSGNPPPSSGGSCTAAAWDAGAAYNGGAEVSYDGNLYSAKWWTQGDNPATHSGPWDVWNLEGACSGGSNPPSSSGNPPPSSGNPPPSSGNPPPSSGNPPPSSGNPPPSSSNPPPTSGNGNHLMIGYWHDFANGAGAPIRIADVPAVWDVIIVAFATDQGNGVQKFILDKSLNEQQFIADVAAQEAAGRKVLISFGGAAGAVQLNSSADVQNFVSSVTDMINTYGFDGIDLDLESGVSKGSALQTNIVTAVKDLKQTFPNLFLTMAPEWPYVQGGYEAYSGIWGSYLPIINGLRNDLDVLMPQLYNNGGLIGPYQNGAYQYPSEDMLVASVKMLVEGFPLNRGSGGSFAPLPASKVAIALPSGPSAASTGYTQPAVVAAAVQCITTDTNCGSVHLTQPQPSFAGVMAWSINWDIHNNMAFSSVVGPAVHSAP